MTVAIESRGTVRIVRVDRTDRLNALNTATLRELARAARSIRRDTAARGIVLTGTGRTFIAGGDLYEFGRVRTAAGARRIAALGHDAIDALRETGLPLVAAVNGDAYGGGCEIAAACDLRVVERHVRFHWVQGRLAVTTGWGGTARLVQLVGTAIATQWLLSARVVDAMEAARVGFADQIVDTGASVDAACAMVESMAAVPKDTLRRQLALIRVVHAQSSDEARMAEMRAFGRCWVSREHREAMARFLSRSRD